MARWRNENADRCSRFYLWSTVIGDLDFSRSLFLVYFLAQGFSGAELGVLQALLFWSSFLLDLPTGIYADRHGRKKATVIGLVFLMITYAVLAKASSFAAAAAGFAMWGVGFAFISGSRSALLYEGLKEAGRLDYHLSWLGRTRSLGTLGMALAIFAGGFLYKVHPTLVFWASAFCALIGLLLFIPVPEPTLHEATHGQGVRAGLKAFFSEARGRNLLLFILGMAGLEMAHAPFFVFSQALFHDQGFSEDAISILMGSAFLASAGLQKVAPNWGGKSPQKMVFGVGIGVVLSLAGLVAVPSVWTRVVLFLIINSLPMFLYVHTDQYVQDHSDSRIRASLLSVHSFISAVLIGLSNLVLGILRDRIGIVWALGYLSVPVALGMILVAWHFQRAKKSEL